MKMRLTMLTGPVSAVALMAPGAAMARTESKLDQILECGTLRVGTLGDFTPMSIQDTATNTLNGFDVEAMTKLATDMGVKVECVPADWAALVNPIVSDRFDIFSGASLSMARARTVALSSPCRCAGTVFEQQGRAHFPGARIRAVEKLAIGYQEVPAGRAQGTITSNVEAATLMATYPDLQAVGVT